MARMERRLGAWAARAAGLVVLTLAAAACSTYPEGPRYPIYAEPPAQPRPYTPPPAEQPDTPPAPDDIVPPRPMPVDPIEAEALPPTTDPTPTWAQSPPPTTAPPATPPPEWRPAEPASMTPGAGYLIQTGDTLSGIARRFQTPVQILIDLNGLGPRGALTQGQTLILPDSAVDTGRDPYATGPSPRGVRVPNGAAPPPPPPPPSGNPAAPAPVSDSADGRGVFQWPVRGEVIRRFGPVGTGERNNGINIGASAGAPVNAAAAGRVAYVGDDLVGQGLVVLLIHADGWRSVYGHLGSSLVEDGDEVRQGQQIGTVGLTAGDGRPSMHFETRRMQGDDPTPIDPLSLLPR
ncbi:peptidoglycan DD-metalloendopeptidase family protein [Brevundimonas sp.]|uniref:peptidoglycan DD-metalloendopeptidase family protein n=1 Tax=Brevundimonas sp. TaxID=1871086 RepID=UPI0035B1F618